MTATITHLPPPPPGEPADGMSCDCEFCDAESVGWRWFPDLREWLPACDCCIRLASLRWFRCLDSDLRAAARPLDPHTRTT